MDVAFLGTGLMGLPLAMRLLRRGHRLSVYNRTRDKALPLAERGAAVRATPASAVADGDWVIMMLADAAAVHRTLLDPAVLPLLAGRRVLNMGTIAPAQTREIGERVTGAGAQFMECPVLGSIPEAKNGTLILMFGGNAEQFHHALPLLQTFGPMPLHVGEVGQASAVKLAMNQLIASLTAAFSISLAVIREEGVAVDKYMTVVRESALYAPTYDKKLSRMLERRFDQPNFPLKYLLKDVQLVEDVMADKGIDTRTVTPLKTLLQDAYEQGNGDSDYSVLYNVVHPRRHETDAP